MNDTLFDLPESKSPKLLWMERHGVATHYNDCGDGYPWEAYRTEGGLSYEDTVLKIFGDGETLDGQPCYPDINPDFVISDTKEGAIVELAKRNGWKLWNEEDANA